MPKVKIKRDPPHTDMTAMCDVAFLLLTFFILTAKFRPQEPVQVSVPSSTSQILVPDKDIMLISVSPEGKVFYGLDDHPTRVRLLDELAKRNNFEVTAQMQKNFTNMDQFGVPMAQLPALLKLSPDDMAKFKQPGIQVGMATEKDSTKNELADLIRFGRFLNPNIRIAVKGDQGADYKSIDKVVETLRKTNTNIFNLITNGKTGPE